MWVYNMQVDILIKEIFLLLYQQKVWISRVGCGEVGYKKGEKGEWKRLNNYQTSEINDNF